MASTDLEYEDVTGGSDSDFELGKPSGSKSKGKGKPRAESRAKPQRGQAPNAGTNQQIAAKRPRGRPRKQVVKEVGPKRPRGRPPKKQADNHARDAIEGPSESSVPIQVPNSDLETPSQPVPAEHEASDNPGDASGCDPTAAPVALATPVQGGTGIDSAVASLIVPALAGTRLPNEPVANMPGVYTDGTLRKLGLGLLNDHGIFYCTLCDFNPDLATPTSKQDQTIGFNLENVRKHINDVHKETVNTQLQVISQALDNLGQYAVWKGPLSGTPQPVPSAVVPPFPFLRTFPSAYVCQTCEGPGSPFISVSKSVKTRHLQKFHNLKGADDPRARGWRRVDAVQTFQSTSNCLRYFEVDVSAPQISANNMLGSSADEKAKVAQAYITHVVQTSKEAETLMGSAHGLSRESPFLNRQGWTGHLAGRNWKDLVALALGSDGLQGFDQIPAACMRLMEQQQIIIGTATPRILRAWLDTDVNLTSYHKLFGTLKSANTLKRYSRIFSQFICLILETTRRLDAPPDDSQDPNQYVARLTNQQHTQARRVLDLLSSESSFDELVDTIQALAVSCFAPENPGEMTKDKYNDIVHVFVMLKSVLSDGSFKPTKDMVNATTALQYMFRSVLLQEASVKADIAGADREAYVWLFYYSVDLLTRSLSSVLKGFLHYLGVENMVNPFGHLKAIRSQMGFDVTRNKPMADFSWSDQTKTTGVYKGHRFEVSKVPEMGRAMLQDTEDILLKDLFFGIPPEELGFVEPKLEELEDMLDDTKLGYSVWTDENNRGLAQMRRSLFHAFIRHEKLDGHFWSKTLPGDQPVWNDGARRKWLERLGDFSLNLMACCHIYGGQPRRGAELTQMRNHNVQGRPRNLMVWHELFIYILGYSKTLAITGLDRTDVHALPPRINRMIYILNGLVRPLAVQWVKELFDEKDEAMPALGNPCPPMSQGESFHNPDTNASEVGIGLVDSILDFPGAIHVNQQLEKHHDSDSNDDQGEETGSEYKAEDASVDLEDEEEEGDGPEEPDEVDRPMATTTKTSTKISLKPSEIQNEMTFARCGRIFDPESLSKILANYTRKFLGKAWGIRPWRHVCIGIQRAHLNFKLDLESSDMADMIMDRQAGHSSKIAAGFYAVEEDDLTLSGSTSVAKYVEASKLLHAWLDGKPIPVIPTQAEVIQKGVEVLQDQVKELSGHLKSSQSEVAQMREKMAEMQEQMTEMQSQTAELIGLVKVLVQRPVC
ncbi:hypothetical protein FRC10_002582 [Ceratobasidium sp. 414]|nr:hypothetical protein FRC10_002582 [Ceratobasidium sp. 414]